MGGKGSGGARMNSGPKRLDSKALWLAGGRGHRAKPAVKPVAVGAALMAVDRPNGLPDQEAVVWDELAPHALAARTLTAGTSAAFRDLCEAIVLKRMMLAEILADGLTGTKVTVQMDESGGGLQSVEKKAHTLLSQYRGMMQRVEAGFTRFRLAPMGKEIVVEQKAVDPFEEFG